MFKRAELPAAAALVMLGFAWVAPAAGEKAETDRLAHLDYMLHCQGCHMADGSGLEGTVPSLRDQVGLFLATPEGRAYLVQVPGASQALIDDAALARLTNWMVRQFDPENTKDFEPYAAAEVGRLRRNPVTNPVAARRRIVAELPRPPQDASGENRH